MLQPGSHVRVSRQWHGLPYSHHGIYVGDSEVVEFGGGNLLDKGKIQVRQVPLSIFADGGSVEVVPYPIRWAGMTFPALPADQVIDRAQWLVYNQPPPYRLGYRNCESIAVWCAADAFESFQVKRFLGWKALGTALVVPTLAKRKPSVGYPLAIVLGFVTLLTAVPSIHSWSFFDHTRRYPGIGEWKS